MFKQCVVSRNNCKRLPPVRNSRDRIVVSTLRCGRSNPGSNPGHGSIEYADSAANTNFFHPIPHILKFFEHFEGNV